MRKKGLSMINMSAKEFDRRFDAGEDLDTLVEGSEKITIEELQLMLHNTKNKTNNHPIILNLSATINDKLQEKSQELNIAVNDLIQVILAQRLGVL
jgi:hypothetical protein